MLKRPTNREESNSGKIGEKSIEKYIGIDLTVLVHSNLLVSLSLSSYSSVNQNYNLFVFYVLVYINCFSV